MSLTIQDPLTPESANPQSATYYPDGSPAEWEIGDYRGLLEHFDLRRTEITMWHATMAPTTAWVTLRLRFCIGPLFGPGFDPRTLRSWTTAEIAGELALNEKDVKEQIKTAGEFWRRRRAEIPVEKRLVAPRPTTPRPEGTTTDQAERSASLSAPLTFQTMTEVAPEQVEQILSEAGMPKITDPDKRLYAARRIAELKRWFEDKKTRETARQIVQAELNLRRYEELLLGNVKAAEFVELEKAQSLLAERHKKLITDIGADEAEMDTQRSIALDTFSAFVRGMQEWHATGERTLIDGIFTADEAVWLLTPAEMRPPQYRPDIVTRMKDALLPENLWAPDYEPSSVQRYACQILSRIVKRAEEDILSERNSKKENATTSAQDPDMPASAIGTASRGDVPAPPMIPSFVPIPSLRGDDSGSMDDFMATS